jgi:hypothetical protein
VPGRTDVVIDTKASGRIVARGCTLGRIRNDSTAFALQQRL